MPKPFKKIGAEEIQKIPQRFSIVSAGVGTRSFRDGGGVGSSGSHASIQGAVYTKISLMCFTRNVNPGLITPPPSPLQEKVQKIFNRFEVTNPPKKKDI